jgi:hypothetical protein
MKKQGPKTTFFSSQNREASCQQLNFFCVFHKSHSAVTSQQLDRFTVGDVEMDHCFIQVSFESEGSEGTACDSLLLESK